ncbi:DUF1643 domain-containing protein [Alkalicoccus daliensis]|uniref:DUF1643 domain-containing protein n=1 Tax=Alkalicoccus daliensis TaxID=745820 RepID=A0A1H0HAQ8_9BACI|nr:DUF1643 domain-containing protein [Alkalicoccus daliensis]SDO16227.1 Protein of unknown function [Alkalicoccus daliensis]
MANIYNTSKVDHHKITIDEETFIKDVDVRYSLTIPFLNRIEGHSVGIVLMNPSRANLEKSDGTVNKLIDFFYDFQLDESYVKDITICNILPVYASNTTSVLAKIRDLHKESMLEKVQKLNENKLAITMKEKRFVVLAWGKPEVKTISNLFYYKEVLRITDLLSITHKDDLYILDIKNANNRFTEHGDPRHAGRAVALKGLKKVYMSELFGLS